MMRERQRPLRRASLASAVAVAVASLLLVGGTPNPATAQGPMHMMQMPEEFADDVEIRIAELHSELQIQPSQEELFKAYAEAMRTNARAITALFVERATATEFSAPAQLRWYAQVTAAHAEAANRLVAPFTALYQGFSEAQKALADRQFNRLRQRRMPMGAR